MSIKVYEAYRLPVSKLSEFLEMAHRAGRLNFAQQVKEWRIECVEVTQADIEDKWAKELQNPYSLCWLDKEKVALRLKWQWLEDKYRAEAAEFSSDSCLFHVQAGFRMWVRGRYVYLYPRGQGSFGALPDYVEDYSYWDNTDPPEWVSPQAWGARGRFWNRLFYGKVSERFTYLDHMVIDFGPGTVDTSFFVEHYLDMYAGRRVNENGDIEEYKVNRELATKWRVLDVEPDQVYFQWQGLRPEWVPCKDWKKFLLPYRLVPHGTRPDQPLQAMIDTRWHESAPMSLA